MKTARISLVVMALVFLPGFGPTTPDSPPPQQGSIFDVLRSIFQGNPPPPPPDTNQKKPRKPRSSLQNQRLGPNGAPLPRGSAALPEIKPTFFVSVFGDSLALLLEQGLIEALADKPDIAILKHTRDASGLVRDDFLDWPKATTEILSGPEHVDIGLMMVGTNDRQAFLKDGKVIADIGSEEWTRLYRARAEAEANVFREKNVKLVWVSMPVMKSEKYSADMSKLNEIYRDVAAQAGATYIDIWQAFSDDKGQFAMDGPDVDGQTARLRTSDGIHFTKAGQRKLASFVEKEIRHLYEAKKPNPENIVLPPAEAALPAPQEPEVPKAPVKIEHPVFGPVISLTAAPISSGGEFVPLLANRKPLSHTEFAGSDAPHSGRTDDFVWPQ